VGGAARGRYALSDEACGYGLDDLKELASTLGVAPAEGRRYLLSWHAPGLGGPASIARTETGVDVGDPDLAELARRTGARGGLFAWPTVRALQAEGGDGERLLMPGDAAPDLRLVVPRLSGPAVARSDGARVGPGFVLVRLEEEALRFVRFVETSLQSQELAEQSSN
jgi:hypothetical protein